MDRLTEDRLSRAAGMAAAQATEALATAAACEELIKDGSHSEGQLWFLVRAMCAEHGYNVEQTIAQGRERAQNCLTFGFIET